MAINTTPVQLVSFGISVLLGVCVVCFVLGNYDYGETVFQLLGILGIFLSGIPMAVALHKRRQANK